MINQQGSPFEFYPSLQKEVTVSLATTFTPVDYTEDFLQQILSNLLWCSQKKYVIRWCAAFLVSTNSRLHSPQLKGSKRWKGHTLQQRKKNDKFLKLLSIALSNYYMLLHQDYCPDLQTKMKNTDFCYFLLPCTYSKQPQRTGQLWCVCVNMWIQNASNESYWQFLYIIVSLGQKALEYLLGGKTGDQQRWSIQIISKPLFCIWCHHFSHYRIKMLFK